MARLALGVVGGIIGSFFGQPGIGFMMGSLVGGFMFPQEGPSTEGPRLKDLQVSSSAHGTAIPVIYGSIRLPGQMIWATDLVEHESSEEQGGKGMGGGGSVTTYTYTCSWANAFCAGPVGGVVKIWFDEKLVYNAMNESAVTEGGIGVDDSSVIDLETIPSIGTAVSSPAQKEGLDFDIYLGTESQSPSATIEADKGAGNVPGHRGLCYIVFKDVDLTDYGNRVPSVTALIAKNFTPAVPAVEAVKLSIGYSGWNPVLVDNDGVGYTWGHNGEGQCGTGSTSPSFIYTPVTITGSHVWQKIVTMGQAVLGLDTDGTAWMWGYINDYESVSTPQEVTGHTFVDIFAELGNMVCYGLKSDGSLWLWAPNDMGEGVLEWYGGEPEATYDVVSQVQGEQVWTKIVGNVDIGMLALDDAGQCWLWNYIEELEAYGWTEVATGHVFTDISGGFSTFYGLKSNGEIWSWGDNTYGAFGSGSLTPSSSTDPILVTGDHNFVSMSGAMGLQQMAAIDSDGALWAWGHIGNLTDGTYLNTHTPTQLLSDKTWAEVAASNYGIILALDTNGNAWTWGGPSNVYLYDGNGHYEYQPVPEVVADFNVDAPPTGTPAQIYPDELSEVVKDLCVKSSILTASDVVVTDLEDWWVRGYAITNRTAIRSAIEPLATAWLFDAVESDYKIKFAKRPAGTLTHIDVDDLCAHEYGQEPGDPIPSQRVEELALPNQVNVIYINPNQNYEQGNQYSRRLVTQSHDLRTVTLPIVLSDHFASQLAEKLLYSIWTERESYEFTLPRKYIYFEPTDVVGIRAKRMRITKLQYGSPGILKCGALRENSGDYRSYKTGAIAAGTPITVNIPGDVVLHLMDIPILRDDDNNAGFYAAYTLTDGKSKAVLYSSGDSWDTSTLVISMPAQCKSGVAQTELAVGITDVWDTTNTVRVELYQGATLESTTEIAVLNGKNAGLLGNEIIQWRTATLVSEGVYTLSNLLRGRRGTEGEVGNHAVGERFVVLNASNVYRVKGSLDAIGLTQNYKATVRGKVLEDITGVDFTNTAKGLWPYSPCDIQGSRSGGDLTITWIRRTRIGGAWRDNVDASLGEESKAYEVDIMNGATVVRTIDGLSTESASYTAAEQTTDFGSPQSSVSVKVYQISASVGRGFPGEATV